MNEQMLIFLAIGAVCGWLAGVLMKGRGFGLIGNMILGVIGAFVGRYIFHFFGFGVVGYPEMIMSGTLGAMILVFLVGLVFRR